MNVEEKVRLLTALGLSEKAARYYLRYETDTWAVVPSFRLLKPLSDDLEFYRGRYRELLVQWQGEGVLEKKDPEAAALLRAGATPEQVENAKKYLRMAGAEDIFVASGVTGRGVPELVEFLNL